MNPIRIHPSAMRRRATLLLAATWLGLHAPLWAQRLDPATLARPTDPALIAAAKAEGKLLFYGTPATTALAADAAAFEKAYGIKVAFQQITTGPIVARIDQEIKAGRMNPDVVLSADLASMSRWVGDKQFARLPDLPYPGRTDYLAQVQVVYQGLLFNTNLVPKAEVPKTWNDVLQPRFAGKIVLGHPRIGPGFASLYYGLLHDPKYGEAFFTKLAAQRPRMVQSVGLISQAIGAGEATIGFTGLPFDAVNLKAQSPNALIDYTYLDVVTSAPTFMGINARASNPHAARLFAAWMMSPSGQATHNGEGRASSVLGNLPGTLTAPEISSVRVDVTTEKVAGEYRALIDMFDRLFN